MIHTNGKVKRFTYAVGSVHTNTSSTELREAGYGELHQIDITDSSGIDEGKDVDGR